MSSDRFTYYDQLSAAIRDPQAPTPVAGESILQKRQRLGTTIYRNNHRHAYTTVLRETFPVVEQLVGEAFFKAMALEYLRSNPPASRVIRTYGKNFPQFIAGFEPAGTLPFLANVARIEFSRLQIFHQQASPGMDPLLISQRLGENLDHIHFILSPALALIRTEDGAISIWRHHHQAINTGEQKRLRLKPAKEHLAFSRPDIRILDTPLDQDQFEILSALQDGQSLSSALECASADWLGTPSNLNEFFKLIIDHHWITDIEKEGE